MATVRNQNGEFEASRGGGRPSSWKPEYNEAIVKFFERERPYREHFDTKGHMQPIPERLPFFEDFARSIGVDDTTLVNWAKEDKAAMEREEVSKYPGFFAAYSHAKHLQKRQIVEGAMVGAYNPQFSIFLAKNVTDLRDKQEMEHTGKDGAPLFLPTSILEKNDLTNDGK